MTHTKHRFFCAFALALATTTLSLTVVAQTLPDPVKPTTQTATVASAQADGEVRKVDRDAKKVTLKHGPIANLDMPAMTMVFQVRDAQLFDRLAVGSKIRFSAEQLQGAYVVTAVDAVALPADKPTATSTTKPAP